MRYKGQISLEFLLSTFFVISILVALLFISSDLIPEIGERTEPTKVNMEMRMISSQMISSSGSHSYGSGGQNWDNNDSALENIESFGLASQFHVLDRGKVENLTSFSSDGLNYSKFRELNNIENQYRFIFTNMPVVHTSESFLKNSPPEDPNITQPDNPGFNGPAGNDIRYGSLRMGSSQYNFLVTSHGGTYDTVYTNSDQDERWNFSETSPDTEGDKIELDSRNFTLKNIQDTSEDGGKSLILSRQINVFGPSIDTSASISKMNRYAVLNESGTGLNPVKMEVFSWRK